MSEFGVKQPTDREWFEAYRARTKSINEAATSVWWGLVIAGLLVGAAIERGGM